MGERNGLTIAGSRLARSNGIDPLKFAVEQILKRQVRKNNFKRLSGACCTIICILKTVNSLNSDTQKSGQNLTSSHDTLNQKIQVKS